METKGKIKAVIYARVSSKDQEDTGYSLPAQVELLKNYAGDKFKIVKVYKISESASGKKIREVFNEMLEYATNKKIPVILCEKIDRLTRTPKDAGVVDDWIREDKKREIHFVKESFVLNQNSKAHENLVWDMKVAIANFYINNLSEEVRKGQKQKVKAGWLPTKPPLGYKTIGEKGHKVHVIDDKVTPFILKMFQLYSTGNYSTEALGEKMYKLGFRSRNGGKVVKSRIHVLLSDPFYYGKFRWNGEVYQGKHEPIINKELFDEVQNKLNGGVSSPYYNKHLTEFKGKVHCGNCKRTVTWERQKGNWYGACKQCKAQLDPQKKYIRQEDMEEALIENIISVAPKSEEVINVLKKALKESHAEESTYHDSQVSSIKNRLQRIHQSKKVLYDDRLDERITTEDYDIKSRELDQEKEDLLHNLERLESSNDAYYRAGFAIHELALKAKDIYLSEKATVEERRLLLAYSFSNIYVLRGEISVEYTKAYEFVANWMPKVNRTLELSKGRLNKEQEADLLASCPTMLRR